MKNLGAIFINLFFLLTVFSCQTPEPKIYKLDYLSYSNNNQNMDSVEYSKKKDYYIVSGYPDNHSDQWALIWSYCESSMSEEDKAYNHYFRYFYRETDDTPINYQENEKDYFNIDRIENHSNDLILRIEWQEGKPFECIFVKNGEIKLISKICKEIPCKFQE